MSRITSAQLESSRVVSGYVDFEAVVRVEFAPHEIGHLWELSMQLREDDIRSDDDLGGPARRNLTATNQEMTVKIAHRLRAKTVDTEWGDEAVYGVLTLRPLNPPPAFITSTARTGIEVVNV
ncbi:MAG: hypothetical protein IGR76_19495 [Synechococcales cyanobacterium T60_A2020_003]|nr:hypothetical protein [Synechococcales cyanobacterium T60_A2020_003]